MSCRDVVRCLLKLQDCLKREDTSITGETAAPERKKTK
ncbi:hypothetical protein [Mixta calida]